MINCTFFLQDERVKNCIIRGHANSAPKGYDIVCAGVSALVQNLAIGFELCEIDTKIRMKDGNFDFYLDDTQSQDAYILTESFKLSITAMSEQYSDYIKVKNEVIL